MITWTQGGTTKSINNNNIVYAKQGADGEPVLIDRIIAVDTSTNPPTESIVYQSNSILKALATSNIEGPSMTGGRAWYNINGLEDYYWITYATQYNGNSIGTTYGTFNTRMTVRDNARTLSAEITSVPSTHYQPTVPVNIQYTYAQPMRVVVKVTCEDTAMQMRVTNDNGWSTVASGGRLNGNTLVQTLYNGLMDATTRNYTFNAKLSLNAYVMSGSSGTGYKPAANWNVYSVDYVQERNRGNLLYVPAAITRTIEIYDPNTGTLIASNTSALSTTWTARH